MEEENMYNKRIEDLEIKVAELELPQSEEKEVILDFIRSSTKGIMRGLS